MRILVVDFEFPEPDRSSGGHRLYHIIELLREAGHELAFLSIDYWQLWKRQSDKYPKMMEHLGVRTCREGWSLSEKGGKFIEDFMPEVAILSKYYMANSLISYLRVTHPFCRLILDTVDVHFVREQRQGAPGWMTTRENEMAACEAVDRVWAITDADKGHLETQTDIHIVPNIHNLNGSGLPFERRAGIVFVGNYVHEPNKDAVWLMMKHIMPKYAELGGSEGFSAVGPYENLLPKYDGLIAPGYIEDLDDVLCRAKVGVAPLRYGAGMKGKIGSYMCNGLPVVTTSIGAEGMGLVDSETALIREPDGFAEAMHAVCTDENLWEKLSRNAIEKVGKWSSGSQKKAVCEAVSFV